MQDKDPLTYSLLTYGWVMLLAVWGGVVNYCAKYRAGIVKRYNIVEFIGDLATSGFSGVITFYLCEYAEFNPLLTAALVGISGHMGARALFMLERFIERRLTQKIEDQ